MKETTGYDDNNQPRGPAGEVPHESLDELLSSYAPKQREKVLKGLRILARVAIRTHMKRQADADSGDRAQDDDEEKRA